MKEKSVACKILDKSGPVACYWYQGSQVAVHFSSQSEVKSVLSRKTTHPLLELSKAISPSHRHPNMVITLYTAGWTCEDQPWLVFALTMFPMISPGSIWKLKFFRLAKDIGERVSFTAMQSTDSVKITKAIPCLPMLWMCVNLKWLLRNTLIAVSWQQIAT